MAKEIGGYDVIFVEDLNKDHECIVCHLALREPVQLSCGHRFCNSCFEQMKLYSVNRYAFVSNQTCQRFLSQNKLFLSFIYFHLIN